MKNKIVCLFLTAVLLTSCGIITVNRPSDTTEADSVTGTGTEKAVTTAYPVETAESVNDRIERAIDELSDADYGGVPIFIARESEYDGIFSEDTGTYAPAVLLRNEKIRNRFNVGLITFGATDEEILRGIKDAKKSGEVYADMVCCSRELFGELVIGKYLSDIKLIPHVRLVGSCYDDAFTDLMRVDGNVYGVFGSATDSLGLIPCVFVNTGMLREQGIGIDFNGIKKNGLSTDDFLAMTAKVSGTIGLECSLDNAALSEALWLASGMQFIGADHTLMLTEGASDALESAKKFIASVSRSDVAAEDFIEGRTAFAVGTVSDIYKLTNCGFVWDILPLPSCDGKIRVSAADMPVMSVISTGITDGGAVGSVLEAIFVSSEGTLRETYSFDLINRHISHAPSIDMLELIFDAERVTDGALIYKSVSSDVMNGTYTALTSAVNKGDGVSVLEKAVDKYAKSVNGALEKLD